MRTEVNPGSTLEVREDNQLVLQSQIIKARRPAYHGLITRNKDREARPHIHFQGKSEWTFGWQYSLSLQVVGLRIHHSVHTVSLSRQGEQDARYMLCNLLSALSVKWGPENKGNSKVLSNYALTLELNHLPAYITIWFALHENEE